MDEALYTELAASERTYWWFVAKRSIILSLIDRYIEPTVDGRPYRALDIGCGTGGLIEDLAGLGFAATGCDTHSASLEACRRLGLEVSAGTLPDDLPFTDRAFDVIVLSDVLEHVEEDAASVEAVSALLAPRGILVCTVPAHPWMWTRRDDLHHHKRRYRRREFRRLFELETLDEELLGYYNSALFPVMIASRALSRVRRTDGIPDVRPLPRPLNALLRSVFGAEKHLLGRVPLPPGGSLVSVHRRVA
jgi:SAM-dependent methyltransferase